MTKTRHRAETNPCSLSIAVRRILRTPVRVPAMLTLAGAAMCGAAHADQLEEVTVTATRRDTTTENIPYSISVVSEKTLEDNHVMFNL